jgi:uncharacterized RDD family membrane protein YckC
MSQKHSLAIPQGLAPTTAAYAGFWQRAAASVIDLSLIGVWILVLCVSVIALFPGVTRVTTGKAPGSTKIERVTTTITTTRTSPDGVVRTEKHVEHGLGPLGRVTVITTQIADGKTLITTGPKLNFGKIRAVAILWLITLLAYAYWVLMEWSRVQASLGKMLVGIKVVDRCGGGLPLSQAATRVLLKILSIWTLCVGFLLARCTSRKQALHDLISRSYVVRKRGAS